MSSNQHPLLTEFHTLSGTTIGKRRKHLFLLLEENKDYLKTSKNINFLSIQPRSILEENFRIDIFRYLKRPADLLNILKEENPTIIQRILKTNWFIEEAFKDINGDLLATEIFPCLSYNSKLKLLNKFSLNLRNGWKGDEYFLSIRRAYGLYLAAKLLPACSSNLIITTLKENRIEVTPKQFLLIIKRHPHATEDLFEILNQQTSKLSISDKYQNVFYYVSKHNIPLFISLQQKYSVNIQLGTRASKKFLLSSKDIIIRDSIKYNKILKRKTLKHLLKQDFEKFYMNLFPQSMNELKYNIEDYLLIVNNEMCVFLNSFEKVYGSSFWDYPNLVTSKEIELMTPNEREKWMEIYKKPEYMVENRWISLMKTPKSVDTLKNTLLLTTNLYEKVKLVGLLIKTCRINEDYKSLYEVIKFIVENYTKDQFDIHKELLITFHNCRFNFEKLSDHWPFIMKSLEDYNLQYGHISVTDSIIIDYICYCFKNELPVKDMLQNLMKKSIRSNKYIFCLSQPEYCKKAFTIFYKLIPSTYEDKELQENYMLYLHSVIQWNKMYPKECIPLLNFPDALRLVTVPLNNGNYTYEQQEIAAYVLLSDFETFEEAGFVPVVFMAQFYFNRTPLKIMRLLIQKHPLIFKNHIQIIVKKALSISIMPSFDNLYKSYSHLGIPEEISAICMNILQDNDIYNDKKIKAAAVLSHMMDANDFLTNVELMSNKGYKLQVLIPKIKNIMPPCKALEGLLKYCTLDYLKYSKRLLYSLAHNVSENKLILFFDRHNNENSIIQKHSIFLAFKVFSQMYIYDFSSKLIKNNKDPLISKSLLKGIFNYFITNSDDCYWYLTQECVLTIDIQDTEAFNILTQCRKIPFRFIKVYIMFVWKTLDDREDKMLNKEIAQKGRCRLLNIINSNVIQNLPNDWCMSIINKYLFKSDDVSYFEKKIHGFTTCFLIYQSTEPEFLVTLEIIKKFIQTTWFNLDSCVCGRKMVSNFLKEFCSYFINNKCLSIKVIQNFLNFWNTFLKPHQAFEEYSFLKFTLLYVNSLNEKLTLLEIGEKLSVLCDSMHNNSNLMVNIFIKTFLSLKKNFLLINSTTDLEDACLTLIEGIIKRSNSPFCLTLVILLLPNKVVMAPDRRNRYNSIIELLLKQVDPLVQTYLHIYLKDQ